MLWGAVGGWVRLLIESSNPTDAASKLGQVSLPHVTLYVSRDASSSSEKYCIINQAKKRQRTVGGDST